jgi:hypothetical protein
MRRLVCGVAVVVASGCAGCGGNSNNSATATPAAPTPTAAASTESFSGTVTVAGNDFHPFTVATTGATLSVTLTAAGPPTTIFMGLGLGAYDAPTCTLLNNAYLTTQAGAVAQLSGTAGAGAYCVVVYDVGNQTGPITYAVTVSHY